MPLQKVGRYENRPEIRLQISTPRLDASNLPPNDIRHSGLCRCHYWCRRHYGRWWSWHWRGSDRIHLGDTSSLKGREAVDTRVWSSVTKSQAFLLFLYGDASGTSSVTNYHKNEKTQMFALRSRTNRYKNFVRTRVDFARQQSRSRPRLAILQMQNIAPSPAQAQNRPQGRLLCLVRALGIEPRTFRVSVECSTN